MAAPKVDIYTLCARVQLSLGSDDCVKFLDQCANAPDNHLQLEQTSMYVNVLWEENWYMIWPYQMINVVSFLLLGFTVLFAPDSTVMFTINTILSVLILLNEFR